MKFSYAVLRAEWKRATPSMRYFLASHVVANLLMSLLSIASVIVGALGSQRSQVLLLVVACLCGGQALLAWSVLQKRFGFRYSLW
jgi:hypothetical protein